MAEAREAFVGIDVAKLRNAVAVADAGRDGEVRYFGEVDASPDSMRCASSGRSTSSCPPGASPRSSMRCRRCAASIW